MADFATARRRMVDNQLRTSNLTDRRILAAMDEVPRERFVPESRQPLAYADTTHELGAGRSLGAPAPFGKLLQLAEVAAGDTVLDIGAGTGYSTAVLARLAARVIGVESDPALVGKAVGLLAELGVANASVVAGTLDGAGQPRDTFDVIVLEGAVTEVSESLFALLKDGGRLVALVQGSGAGVAHVYVRSGDDIATRADFNAALPPLSTAVRDVVFQF